MAGNSICLEPNMILCGKYGRYRVKNTIGRGGNGVVYAVDVCEGTGLALQKRQYVIKCYGNNINNVDEYKKRRSRFIKEIEKVFSFQDSISGIIPICDSSVYCDKDQDPLWYLMPRAELFIPQNYTVEQRLEHLKNLGYCIRQLHTIGYAHRDIKLKNLLILNGRLCLSDFGLVWNIADQDEHITEVNDRLGPQGIRPPEFQTVVDVDNVDYRKSDVYLYAKTIWMVLQCNKSGFSSEYSRTDDNVYIVKEKYQLETAEPLHCLMEGATKHNYWERIDIDACLFYLENQLRVITGDIPQNLLLSYKFDETTKHINATISPDEKIFTNPSTILEILEDMEEVVSLVFFDAEEEYGRYPLGKVKQIQNNLYEIEILIPYKNSSKIIEVAIRNIILKNMIFEIQLSTCSFEDKTIPLYTQITKAVECPDKHVRLNACYGVRMEKLR